jgi:hypothetical protein
MNEVQVMPQRFGWPTPAAAWVGPCAVRTRACKESCVSEVRHEMVLRQHGHLLWRGFNRVLRLAMSAIVILDVEKCNSVTWISDSRAALIWLAAGHSFR